MSLNPNREATGSTLADSVRLVCPHCDESITFDSLTCHHCGFEGSTEHGVPSLIPDHRYRDGDESEGEDSQWLDEDELAALAAAVEREPIRDATKRFLEDHEHRGTVLDELYNVRRDAWVTLVSESITGRCLDIDAGFGRRALTLAERSKSVVAVDSTLSRVRIMAARDDYESADRLIPLHTTEDQLPFASGSFDTIVANFTGSCMSTVRTRLSHLNEYLADDGTIVFIADGWPRRAGLTGLAGMDCGNQTGKRELTAGTPDGYRSLITDSGFDETSLYTLFPTVQRPLFVFDVENEYAVETLSDFVFSERGPLVNAGRPFVSLGNRSGLLKRLYPNVLAVCTNNPGPSESASDFDDPLLVPGRARSVVLDTGRDGIDRVWKFPNRKAHSPLTQRENSILSYLNSTNEPIVDTLPHGKHIDSQVGEARVEEPVEGSTLEESLSGDLLTYERTLRLGFDWLIEFQQTFRGPTVTRSPVTVRNDLRFEPTDLEPPEVNEPVETFFTPVHGDYLPGNIHAVDDEVTSVIDWEYGAVEASPIIDSGFLVLNTATQVFGGLEEAFQTVFCEDNEYARITRSMIRGYCAEVGIPMRTFLVYLPSVFLHRLELDWQFDAVSTYTEKIDDRSWVVDFMFENLPDVELD